MWPTRTCCSTDILQPVGRAGRVSSCLLLCVPPVQPLDANCNQNLRTKKSSTISAHSINATGYEARDT